jgi:alanine racemase
MEIGVCNSYMLIDLRKIKQSIEKVKTHIGAGMDILPVLKGNAYGLGLAAVAGFMAEECGIRVFATAQTYEAVKLLDAGIKADFLVMGGVPFHNIQAVVANDIQVPAYNMDFLSLLQKEAKKQGKIAKVHIKIETGLNRIGVKPGRELNELCSALKLLENVCVVGAYTHFSDAEIPDHSITQNQYQIFIQGMAQISSFNFSLSFIHACNSAATTWFQHKSLTHVRPGGLCLGFDPSESSRNILGLEEPLTWRSFVTNVKTIKAGETVGYNRVFMAKDTRRVITMSFGYGDGYNREVAFKGANVLIRGKKAPVIGICMDQTFADVSHIDGVSVNDTVTVIGRDGDEFISVFDLQQQMGQTYMAGITTITDRVKRIYIR